MSNDNQDDRPYGISPAMQALPALRAFNDLPIDSPERRDAIRFAVEYDQLLENIMRQLDSILRKRCR